MNDEGARSGLTDGFGAVTTFCYDGATGCLRIVNPAPRHLPESADQAIYPAGPPRGAPVARQPILTHTFEFRLSGSEREERALA